MNKGNLIPKYKLNIFNQIFISHYHLISQHRHTKKIELTVSMIELTSIPVIFELGIVIKQQPKWYYPKVRP